MYDPETDGEDEHKYRNKSNWRFHPRTDYHRPCPRNIHQSSGKDAWDLTSSTKKDNITPPEWKALTKL